MQLVIMRHGQTDDNVDHRYTGTNDVPLNESGREQAHAAGLAPSIPLVFTSHLSRAQETARICFPNAQQMVRPALSEMNFGDFQGRTPNEMEDDAAYRAWVDQWCIPPCPNGESREGYTARVAQAVREIVLAQAAAGDGQVVIVAHGGTIMATLSTFANDSEMRSYYEWNPGNCGGYRAQVLFNGADDFILSDIERFDSLDFLRESPTKNR